MAEDQGEEMGVDVHGQPFGTFAEMRAEVDTAKAGWPARAAEIERRLAEEDVPPEERTELEGNLASLRAAMRLDSRSG